MFTPTSGRRGHTPGPLLVMPDDEGLISLFSLFFLCISSSCLLVVDPQFGQIYPLTLGKKVSKGVPRMESQVRIIKQPPPCSLDFFHCLFMPIHLQGGCPLCSMPGFTTISSRRGVAVFLCFFFFFFFLLLFFPNRLSLSQNQRHIPREEERSDEEEQQDSHIDDLPPPTRPKISRIPIGNLKDDRAVSPSPHEKSKRTTPRSPRAILSKLIVKDGKGSGHVSNRSSSSSSNVTNTSPRMVNNGPTSSSSIGTISEPSPRLQSRAIHSPRGPRGTDGSLSHPITLNFDAIERGF